MAMKEKGKIALYEFSAEAKVLRACSKDKHVEFFNEIVPAIEMKPVSPSLWWDFDGNGDPSKSGVTVIRVIEESAITLHTFPELEPPYARLLIDTCGKFDEETDKKVRRLLRNHFLAEILRTEFISPMMPEGRKG